MILRPYQFDTVEKSREALKSNRCVVIQLCTGTGKTVIFAYISRLAYELGNIVWIVVPRIDLLDQASKHLQKHEVPHGIIQGRNAESRAFNVHVISRETIIRRVREGKIKRWPGLLIFDECHIALEQQIEIISYLPADSQALGFTATPELTSGAGLSPPWNLMIQGPSIPWFTKAEFLVPLKYYAPPIDSMDELKLIGTEIDAIQHHEFLKARKIYGQAVEHYEDHGKGKTALIFCRSVDAAYELAGQFKAHGHDFYCIEGNRQRCPDEKRKELLEAARNRQVSLVNCDIATYGIDIPPVEYGASLRLTQSRALFFQMIGRTIRPYEERNAAGTITYKKEYSIFCDHVGLVDIHQEEKFPGVPPFYVDEIEWNFHGNKDLKRKQAIKSDKICKHIGYQYCEKSTCKGCEFKEEKEEKPEFEFSIDLQLIAKDYQSDEIPTVEKRSFVDRINKLGEEYQKNQSGLAVSEALELASKFGYKPIWVYQKLSAKQYAINIPLLHEIGKQMEFKPRWARMQIDKLRKVI